MKSTASIHIVRMTTLTLAAALTACGGGGGDASNATSAPNATEPSQQAIIPIILNVAPGSYAANSQELKIFDLINLERNRCGFGKIAQDLNLDKAASMHTKYLIENNEYSHSETMGKPFFSGVNSQNRTSAAGFAGSSIGEGLAASFYRQNEEQKSKSGELNVKNLLSAPFHALSLLSPRQNVGIGHGFQQEGEFERHTTTLNYGTPSTSNGLSIIQDLPKNDVLTYPCEGTVNVERGLFGEVPSPYPNRDLNVNPIGASIYLAAKSGSNITVTSYELLNVATNKKESLLTPRYGDKEIYPGTNSKFDSANLMNWVFIAPDKILDQKTSYQAIIKGTVSGKDFTKSLTFTTK